MFPFLVLPNEVREMIAVHMSVAAIGRLRRSCRELRNFLVGSASAWKALHQLHLGDNTLGECTGDYERSYQTFVKQCEVNLPVLYYGTQPNEFNSRQYRCLFAAKHNMNRALARFMEELEVITIEDLVTTAFGADSDVCVINQNIFALGYIATLTTTQTTFDQIVRRVDSIGDSTIHFVAGLEAASHVNITFEALGFITTWLVRHPHLAASRLANNVAHLLDVHRQSQVNQPGTWTNFTQADLYIALSYDADVTLSYSLSLMGGINICIILAYFQAAILRADKCLSKLMGRNITGIYCTDHIYDVYCDAAATYKGDSLPVALCQLLTPERLRELVYNVMSKRVTTSSATLRAIEATTKFLPIFYKLCVVPMEKSRLWCKGLIKKYGGIHSRKMIGDKLFGNYDTTPNHRCIDSMQVQDAYIDLLRKHIKHQKKHGLFEAPLTRPQKLKPSLARFYLDYMTYYHDSLLPPPFEYIKCHGNLRQEWLTVAYKKVVQLGVDSNKYTITTADEYVGVLGLKNINGTSAMSVIRSFTTTSFIGPVDLTFVRIAITDDQWVSNMYGDLIYPALAQ